MIPPLLTILPQLPRDSANGVPGDSISTATDTLAAAVGSLRDTLSAAPLPGGAARIFRFFFQVPQSIQIGGALLGAAVAGWVLLLLWRRRLAILGWLGSRSRGIQVGLAGGVLAAVGLASILGMKSWNFMMHDNDFCTGCHVMERPFRRFVAGAGKHQELSCHNCHVQGMYANVRQLVLWVAERPEKIGAHAPVPNSRCEGCHQPGGTGSNKEIWQHVRRLAGHRVHFDSDSSALKGLACVKCHGAEVHRFIPSARTCGQSGCHEQKTVKLAGMAKLPEINCVTCHAFKKDLPALATTDSARRALVPAHEQCLGCHQMKNRPTGFDLARDPHKGSCGSCHDVHLHTTPADAKASCQKCHADLSRSAFHNGKNHARVREQCLTCHLPHAASRDASDCAGCHNDVRRRGLFKPPMPFDTNAVLKKRVALTRPAFPPPEPVTVEHRGKGDELPEELPPVRASPDPIAPPARASPDSFPHPRHASLPCLTCHVVNRTGAGLTFSAPRGCDLCHHQAVVAGRVEATDCARCHRAEAIARPRETVLRIGVGRRAPVARSVGFRHERHARLACADCHRPPGIMPADSVRTCAGCHDQHHDERRDCTQCHNRSETPAAHARTSHVACDDCHTRARVAALVPARNFCLTCHAPQRDHRVGRECSACHFLETPAEFRRRLLRAGPG